MTETQVLDLRSPASGSQGLSGSKGAALATLVGNAMPVPEGFVVTTDAFLSFLAGPGLSSTTARLLNADWDEANVVVNDLRQGILATALPRALEAQVSRKLEAYPFGSRALWAVRASPGGDGAAYTTVYESVLGVSSDEVIGAIRCVWSAAFSKRAVQIRCGGSPKPVPMAVVVQRLLRSETAGVCSTADRVWRRNRLVVYASYGLGESIARRTVVPDTHVVDRVTLEPIIEIIGSKRMQTIVHAEGVAETGVPKDKQKQFCLSPRQVVGIARLAKAVESTQGSAVDVDWAFEDGKLYLVQAQPTPAH